MRNIIIGTHKNILDMDEDFNKSILQSDFIICQGNISVKRINEITPEPNC